MERNTHKYALKLDKARAKSCMKNNPINVSRSIGNTGNWMGCGFINKTGNEIDHQDIVFPFFSMVYVVTGNGSYIDEDGRTHPLKKGSLFQRRPGISHSTIIDPDHSWKEYYIDLDTDLYTHLTALGILQHQVPVYQLRPDKSIPAEFEALIQLLDQSSERRLPDLAIKIIHTIRDWVNQGNWHGFDQDTSDMIEISCLDFNLSVDKRIDLKSYCQDKGWGYETFRKAFKKAIGMSPKQYMVRRRMDEACRLLRSEPLRISQIASRLGYPSPYEFSSQFKRQIGVFPSQFRNGTL